MLASVMGSSASCQSRGRASAYSRKTIINAIYFEYYTEEAAMEQIHETMKGATVTRMQVGPLATNCYLAQSGTELMLIDPGMASDRELEDVVTVIESTHANLRWVVCTHGHLDHVSGADAVMSRFPTATLLMNPMEVALARKPAHSSDLKMRSLSTMHTEPSPLAAGDELPLGLITYRIAAVPGHTPGGLV